MSISRERAVAMLAIAALLFSAFTTARVVSLEARIVSLDARIVLLEPPYGAPGDPVEYADLDALAQWTTTTRHELRDFQRAFEADLDAGDERFPRAHAEVDYKEWR